MHFPCSSSGSDDEQVSCAERGTGDLDMTRMRESGNRQMDYLSTAFEGSRKAVNAAIDKICEFTGENYRSLSAFWKDSSISDNNGENGIV